jgi:hypothetical protein
MVDPSGPGGSPSDYAVLAIAHWVAQTGDAIDPADMRQATQLVRKLRRGKSVWTVTFIITGGLIILGACSKGLGIIAFITALILGGVIASVVSSLTSRPSRREQAFLMRVEQELSAG